ncbi:MAG: hypothetical protein K2J89_05120 [Clostridia bacterium]|nr:hypothetical protein [Clostridia bacterium]
MSGLLDVSNKTKEQNNKYTQECKEIYNNLQFAHVRRITLWSSLLYLLYGFWVVILAAIIFSAIISPRLGYESDLASTLLSIIIPTVFFCILLAPTIFCAKSYRKKGRQFYFLKNDDGEFQFGVENIDGRLYLKYIADIKRRKGLSIEDEKCSIYNWSEKSVLSQGVGLYQYIVPPSKVYLYRNFRENDRSLYKKKTTVGNKVYYRFRGNFGGVIGARYARCIKLKNGIIQYITTQETYGSRNSKGVIIFTNYKYFYNHVNDNSVKIYIPRYVREYASKHKFTLPRECDNILYEEDLSF